MNIEEIPIAELDLDPANVRQHDEKNLAAIKSSLKRFGQQKPIVVDPKGIVIAGNGTLTAARALGWDRIRIVRTQLEGSEATAYAIADNRTAELATWDDDALMQQLSALDLEDSALVEAAGFSAAELEGMVDGLLGEKELNEDEVPEVPEDPITQPGDLWILGDHRLLCGDSTKTEDVERLMGGEKANICFTSPPYNAGSMNIKGNKTTGKKYNSFDDNQTEQEFFDFLFANMSCMLASADEVFYNIGLVQDNKRTIFKIIDAFGQSFKDIIYWKKKTVAPHIQKGVINNLVEFIICFGDGKRKFLNPQFCQGTYWNVIEGANASRNEFSDIHKATFPIYLPENIITNFTARNAIVIDCFGGTGTTLIACEKTARHCRMMELDPAYCDVIVERWENLTGRKAELERRADDDQEKIQSQA